MKEFFWMGRRVSGCDTLLEAADAGDVQARYMCAMLLLTPGVGDEADASRGVEMFANVMAAGKIELCRKLFGQLFANPQIGVHLSDPGKPIVCRSSVCPTRGTMGTAKDSSSVSCVQCLAEFESSILFIISDNHSTKFLQMAGSPEKDTKKVDVSVQHECPLNLLPREIWSIIATKVASSSIEDLFNMQATCKVFLGAARSDAVYKHATMSYKSLAQFLGNHDGPERRFLDRGNVDAIVRHEFTEYLRFGRRDKGMELLARASTEGSVEAGYLSSILLMFDHEDEEDMVRGVQMMVGFINSGQLESYTNFLTDVCKDNKVILNELLAHI
ncbi:hypothetical protein Ahy_A01g001644 isoform A [Arachis hypogaea]|uniref:At2g35280-like TPR domain-containing protein n=1 Tax=Arachis hypogaea TaxID=3818 RepID=A0A445EPE2_ARAHY|nr:hypothetical protein Ahy_A01g001644 isoform A [Arachis hypogaea]